MRVLIRVDSERSEDPSPGPASLYYKNAMSVCQSVRQSVSQSVRNRLPVFSGHPPKTPPIELKSNHNTRGGQGTAAKIYSGRNSFKKKVENFCEKNVEKHVVKCMGIFTSPRGDPYENDQKSPKITKIGEIREITGTWGFTRVLPGSNGLTRVHTGAHGCTQV